MGNPKAAFTVVDRLVEICRLGTRTGSESMRHAEKGMVFPIGSKRHGKAIR